MQYTDIQIIQQLFWLFNKSKKLETENILINEKDYKDMIIYFIRYDCGKLIRMLSLCYH